ncbi:MAG: rhomboid family intramembrane serine protease [Bacteroidales bacterium]|nr:rhomboid family intramembrane serine protease [Bacteroidales bacterium]MDY5442388.1 rhomboid family intramembrane serine protease [Candidatus Cryptobacteroides sp.]
MITVIIIAITCIVSILCFNGTLNGNKLIFNAYQVWHRKEWYRMLTSGIIHSGWGHLFFNMLTLYFFGRVVEQYFSAAFGGVLGAVLYVMLYVSALAISSLGDLVKYRDNWNYNALGASGAVSAVLFASILFAPKMGIYIYLIPIPVPGYIFAPLYLLYCWYMAKRNMDNIGHTAHFWGAVYGILFPILCKPDVLSFCLSQFNL